MDILLLRFDAPMMSFGGVAVDELRRTDDLPGRSLLTGLIANALGYDHAETERLQALQERIRHAVRTPVVQERMVDFQKVDLGLPHMTKRVAWTTRGKIEVRGGGSPEGTHLRYRHYLVDGVVDVALTLVGSGDPDIGDVERALRRPARPLFLGRKCAIPSRPVLERRVEAPNLSRALRAWEPEPHRGVTRTTGRLEYLLWTDADAPTDGVSGGRHVSMSDMRDWRQQAHFGRRWMHGEVTPWLP